MYLDASLSFLWQSAPMLVALACFTAFIFADPVCTWKTLMYQNLLNKLTFSTSLSPNVISNFTLSWYRATCSTRTRPSSPSPSSTCSGSRSTSSQWLSIGRRRDPSDLELAPQLEKFNYRLSDLPLSSLHSPTLPSIFFHASCF